MSTESIFFFFFTLFFFLYQFFTYFVVHHDREKHHVTLQAPKAVPFLTVMSVQFYSAGNAVFLLITDLCSLNLIVSPWG